MSWGTVIRVTCVVAIVWSVIVVAIAAISFFRPPPTPSAELVYPYDVLNTPLLIAVNALALPVFGLIFVITNLKERLIVMAGVLCLAYALVLTNIFGLADLKQQLFIDVPGEWIIKRTVSYFPPSINSEYVSFSNVKMVIGRFHAEPSAPDRFIIEAVARDGTAIEIVKDLYGNIGKNRRLSSSIALASSATLMIQTPIPARATISVRGDIIAAANLAKTVIDTINFTLTSAGQAGSVDLSATGVVVTYLDSTQAINCKDSTSRFTPETAECRWTMSWISGSGEWLDPGELVDVTLSLTNLPQLLSKNKEFTINVWPNNGAVFIVKRTTPAELKALMSLE